MAEGSIGGPIGVRFQLTMHPLIKKNQVQLRALAQRYGVGSLRVFGSMARGDATASSDVDLLLEDTAKLSGFQMGALQMDAQDLLGCKVDVLTENALHPLIREKILKEAIAI